MRSKVGIPGRSISIGVVSLVLVLYITLVPSLPASVDHSHVTAVDPKNAEQLALDKFKFAMLHPFDEYPDDIKMKELSLSIKRKDSGLFDDLIVKYSAIEDVVELKTPEEVLFKVLREQPYKKALVIDVGANVGQSAIPLAKDGHRVYSFEPDASTCDVLKSNLEKNGVSSFVSVACVGIDDKRGQTAIGYYGSIDPGSAGHKIVDIRRSDAHVTSMVQTAPVQDFVSAKEIERATVFKTDTQGNEEAVLRGSAAMLSSPGHPRFLLIEFSGSLLNAAGTTPLTLLQIVYKYNYVCTHLVFHHRLQKEPLTYGRVDTPHQATVENGRHIIPFQALVDSIGKHRNWAKDKELLPNDVQGGYGWTDLLCVG